MLAKKQGLPEEDELVLCTVTSVQHHSVFVNLDEYGKTAMIHISEVAPGRIRNIRDYVKEGKVVVCKVLKINERGNVDISLRRVTEAQRRAKINQIKQGQKAEKIVEFIARKLGRETSVLYDALTKEVLAKYETLYLFFEELSLDEKLIENFSWSNDIKLSLVETIKTRIKPVEVSISGKLGLTSYDAEGVDIVKKALVKARNTDIDKVSVTYSGGGKYNVIVNAGDYKTAEKILGNVISTAVEDIEKSGGTGEFVRDE